MIVYGDAEEADLALVLQVLDRFEPVTLANPLVLPDVELLDGYRLEPQVRQARLGTLPNLRVGEDLIRAQARGGRPDPVHRRYLRGDVDGLVPLFHHPAYEPLGVPIPVGERRVYKVEAEVYGPV